MRVNAQRNYLFYSRQNRVKRPDLNACVPSSLKKESRISAQANFNFTTLHPYHGKEDYTKEDAINSAWTAQYGSIPLDGHGTRSASYSPVPPPDYLSSLEQNGYTPKLNFTSISIDCDTDSSNPIKQNTDYIASRYVVLKDYITRNFSGDEREANMKKLDELMDSKKKELAQAFSNQVGGFFEKCGINGENNEIYNSVLSDFDARVANYSAFIKSNKNYAKIDGTKDEWLKNDSAYMASELRKAMDGTGTKPANPSPDCYSPDELNQMQTFTEEMDKYYHTQLNIFGTSEEIGMQLSEVLLKSEMFQKHANVSGRVQDLIRRSTDGFISNAVQSAPVFWNKRSTKGANLSEVWKTLISEKRDGIYAIINNVKRAYKSTGDFYKALLEGAVYAENQQHNKEAAGIYRSGQSTYWNNFFKNINRFPATPDRLGIKQTGYIQEKCGIESIVDSWNNFADRISADSSAKLKTTFFSEYM